MTVQTFNNIAWTITGLLFCASVVILAKTISLLSKRVSALEARNAKQKEDSWD